MKTSLVLLAWKKREKRKCFVWNLKERGLLENLGFEDIISGVEDTRIYTNKRNIR